MHKKLIYAIIAMFFLTGCDDENSPAAVDSNTANAISRALILDHAQFINADFPEPSNDPNAPRLDAIQDEQKIRIKAGEKIVISSILSEGEAKGFYVKVSGANGYFNVNSGQINESNSRTNNNYSAFRLSVPENMEETTFTLTIATYDAEQNSSNTISKVIEVVTETSNLFYDIQWSGTAIKEFYNGNISVDSLIKDYTYPMYHSFYCESQQEVVSLPYNYYVESNSFLTFSPDGQIYNESIFKYRPINYDATSSACTMVLNDTLATTDFLNGSWEYDDSSKKLTITYTYRGRFNDSFYEGEEIEPMVLEFIVSLDGGNLTLSKTEGEWLDEYHYKPRNQ